MSEDAKAVQKRRLAEALRSNLRRRKAAAQERRPDTQATPTAEVARGAGALRGPEDEG